MTGIWAHTRLDNAPQHVTFSHDSRYLAYHEEREKSIVILEATTGEQAVLS